MSSGEVFTVEISGISDISAKEIEVHFQKRKYGGGDVTVTNLKDGKAVMIIEGIALESEIKKYIETHVWTRLWRRVGPFHGRWVGSEIVYSSGDLWSGQR